MHRCLSQVRLAAGNAIAAIGWSASATAQSFNRNAWRSAVAPYMWASGLEGDIGVGPVSSSVGVLHGMRCWNLGFVAAGDGGGGGSRDTWQAYTSLGYDAWSRWRLGTGYRVLAVNYDRNDFLFDTRSEGFEVVATYRTW